MHASRQTLRDGCWDAVKQRCCFCVAAGEAVGSEGREAEAKRRVAAAVAAVTRKPVFVSTLVSATSLCSSQSTPNPHPPLPYPQLGCTLSVLGGWRGSAMVPEGTSFVMQSALEPASFLAVKPWGSERRISVNSFTVDYYPSGRVSQFRSDLSVVDESGNELSQQNIEVNIPLKFGGVTAYQTDWAIAAVTARVGSADAQPVRLPMASLEGAAGFTGRIWGSFIPLGPPPPGAPPGARPPGITVVARDFQSVAVYDQAGAFVGVRRPGSNKARARGGRCGFQAAVRSTAAMRAEHASLSSPLPPLPYPHSLPAPTQAIEVDGVSVFVDGLTGATGLELKADPGVGLVYLGFAIVMPTTFFALLTWSQARHWVGVGRSG